MWIENKLSTEDMERAGKIAEMTPLLMAGAYQSLIDALDTMSQEIVVPLIQQRDDWSQRGLAFIGLFYRILGFARTVRRLNSTVYQQSLTGAERSVIELWMDVELLHQDTLKDGVERFFAFADYQKLRAARRTVDFFAKNPALDETPSSAEPHQQFIATNGVRIDANTLRLWGKPGGKPPKPDHWTGMNVMDRAKRLGRAVELRVIHGYDMRNFHVHTGVAGIIGMPPLAFETMSAQAINNVADCTMSTLRILGKELDLHKSVDVYDKILDDLDDIPMYSVADKILQNAGEPQRFWLHGGAPQNPDGPVGPRHTAG